MLKLDRMDFPNRYRPRDIVIIFAILGAIFGVWLNDHNQKRLAREVIFSDVQIADYGTNYIDLDYSVENLGKQAREIRVLAKVFDAQGLELGSAMFIIEVPPRSKQARNKIFKDLTRALKDGEAPGKAFVKLYPRTVF